MAHKMAIHAENYKKGSVGALEHHNLRENESYSNKDIDPERTKYNVVLKQPAASQYQDTKNIIDKAVNQVRSTSIWQSEFIVSSDKEFFSNLSQEEQNRFFAEAYSYLSNEFGAQNVTCAVVHYDETTPHMHFDFVPMTEDSRLSRKEVMTRERLLKIQDGLPKYLKEKGFDIERGRKMAELAPKDRPKHMEPKEYKKALEGQIRALERQEKRIRAKEGELNKAEKELDSREQKINAKISSIKKKELAAERIEQSIMQLPKGERTISGKIALQEDDYKNLVNTAKKGIILEPEYKKVVKNNQDLIKSYEKLKTQVPTMEERLNISKLKADYRNLEKNNGYLTEQNNMFRGIFNKLLDMPIPASAKKLIHSCLEQANKTVQKER